MVEQPGLCQTWSETLKTGFLLRRHKCSLYLVHYSLFQSIGFSPALYNYIVEELKKTVILVLNKADLAPPSLVVAWQQYFKEKFPEVSVVCFTSFPKDEKELGAGDGSQGGEVLAVVHSMC